jgi:predicted ATPase
VRDLGPAAAQLVKLLPELATVLPDLAPAAPLEPEQEKRRLVHAILQLFGGLAARRPLLVVLEDLHWSDDASLGVLLHLARGVADQSILVLLTYRAEEAHPSLSGILAELDRSRLAAELRLTPLSRAEVDAMLRAIFALDRPVRAEFLDAVVELTEGNPFFVEEVLTSLVAAGDMFQVPGGWERRPLDELRIPRSVQEAVRRRAAHLSEVARGVLALAAVVGRRFDFALLRELTGRDEGELLRLLKEMIDAQLVVEESAERFAFRHALTRQAIYAELLARERKALHRSTAEALERVHTDGLDLHPADLAYHWFEAGAWAEALVHAQRAGEQAQALYAPRVVVQQFTRALEAAAHLAIAPPVPLTRARGQAYETLGEFAAARAEPTCTTRSRTPGAPRSRGRSSICSGSGRCSSRPRTPSPARPGRWTWCTLRPGARGSATSWTFSGTSATCTPSVSMPPRRHSAMSLSGR